MHARGNRYGGWVVNLFCQKFENPKIRSCHGLCDTLPHMNEYYEQELDRLHAKLAAIYRLGKLTPTEQTAAKGLWARIENLQTTMVKIAAKESRFIDEGII